MSLSLFAKEYLITLEFRQERVTLDIFKMLEDNSNSVRIELHTTEDFYKSVKIGDNLLRNFRGASFFASGDLGDNVIEVVDKRIIN